MMDINENSTHANLLHMDRPSQVSQTLVLGADTLAPADKPTHDEVVSTKVHAFAQFLQDAIPAALVPDYLADVFRDESNARLDLARAHGIPLDQIYIGEDCLPSWPNLYWDPNLQPLSVVIQQRLLQYDLAQDLGDLLQREIQVKGSARLSKAHTLGISIDDITIGKSLLPEWTDNQNGRQSTKKPCSINNLAHDDSTSQDAEGHNITSTKCLDDVAIAESSDHDDLAVADVETICSRDSEDDEEGPEEISMNNLVSTQPIYDEYGRSNIIHDVDMVGGFGQSTTVDLEVYLALDDEEWEALPEVELAIDREAFEYYFCTQDAVDIDIPDAKVFCLDKIEEKSEAQRLTETEHRNHMVDNQEETCEEDSISPHSEDNVLRDLSDVDSDGTLLSDSTLCSEED